MKSIWKNILAVAVISAFAMMTMVSFSTESAASMQPALKSQGHFLTSVDSCVRPFRRCSNGYTFNVIYPGAVSTSQLFEITLGGIDSCSYDSTGYGSVVTSIKAISNCSF